MKEKDINSLNHTTWRCQYHIVFAPKYRRMVIYNEIKADIKFIISLIQQEIKKFCFPPKLRPFT